MDSTKDYKFILGCKNEFECDITLGLLKSCEIDAISHYEPTGLETILANPKGCFGLDIYVRQDQFDEAVEILNSNVELEDENDDDISN